MWCWTGTLTLDFLYKTEAVVIHPLTTSKMSVKIKWESYQREASKQVGDIVTLPLIPFVTSRFLSTPVSKFWNPSPEFLSAAWVLSPAGNNNKKKGFVSFCVSCFEILPSLCWTVVVRGLSRHHWLFCCWKQSLSRKWQSWPANPPFRAVKAGGLQKGKSMNCHSLPIQTGLHTLQTHQWMTDMYEISGDWYD